MKTQFLILVSAFSLVLSFSFFASAAGEKQISGPHALTTPEEWAIRERAKKRLYPGGQDEESLKVQAQLPSVTRKMSPATENQAEEAGEPAAADD